MRFVGTLILRGAFCEKNITDRLTCSSRIYPLLYLGGAECTFCGHMDPGKFPKKKPMDMLTCSSRICPFSSRNRT